MNVKNLLTLSLALILMVNVNAQEAADSRPASQEAVVEPISPIEEAPVHSAQTAVDSMPAGKEAVVEPISPTGEAPMSSTQETEDSSMPASEDAVVGSISPIEEAPMSSAQEAGADSMPASQNRLPVTKKVLNQINKFIKKEKKNHPGIIIEYSPKGLEIGYPQNRDEINDTLQSLSTQSWCKKLKSFKIKCASFHTRNLKNVLSKMTNLQELHLANTDLGTKAENFLKSLGETLSSLSGLQTLSLTGNDKLSFKIRALLPDSTKVSNLQKLFLANNDLNNIKKDDTLKTLKEKLSSFSKLEVLDLGGNELGSKLVKVLPDSAKVSNLQKLYLQNSSLDTLSKTESKTLNKILSSFPKLEILNLSNNVLKNSLTALLPRLFAARNPQTISLDLENKRIGYWEPEALEILNKILLSCSHLKELNLFYNSLEHLDNELLNDLANVLSSFSNLEVLDLGGNELRGKLIELLPDSTKTPNLKKIIFTQ